MTPLTRKQKRELSKRLIRNVHRLHFIKVDALSFPSLRAITITGSKCYETPIMFSKNYEPLETVSPSFYGYDDTKLRYHHTESTLLPTTNLKYFPQDMDSYLEQINDCEESRNWFFMKCFDTHFHTYSVLELDQEAAPLQLFNRHLDYIYETKDLTVIPPTRHKFILV